MLIAHIVVVGTDVYTSSAVLFKWYYYTCTPCAAKEALLLTFQRRRGIGESLQTQPGSSGNIWLNKTSLYQQAA